MKKVFIKQQQLYHQAHKERIKETKNKHFAVRPIHPAKLIILGLTSLFTAFALTLWWYWDAPLTSPISELTSFSFLQRTDFSSDDKKVIYGFLPYWNIDDATIQPELTHLGFFALTISPSGQLLTTSEGGSDPGYSALQSEEFLDFSQTFLAQNGTMDIVLTQFNADDITAFLASENAQDRLINELDSVILAFPISGVNIDIEMAGSPSTYTRNNMTKFVAKLDEHLDSKYENISLSIDMYASAASTNQIWDVEKIAEHVDYIVVMAYDFHRRSSPQAGPVAPLFGGDELWDSDISGHLQDFLAVVPADKILLGVPFYGYEWQTTSRDSQSHTFPDTGSTASFKRVLTILEQAEELEVQQHWNDEALSPYISYKENGGIYVIYYEDSRSLSYKLDYVNQLDLGGVAIWALGYDGQSRELWDVIERKLAPPSQ